jgi:hypothetical protein
MSGLVECEFATTFATEKSDDTCALISERNATISSPSWHKAAGSAVAISSRSRTYAPHAGTTIWKTATSSASTSAK